MKIYFNIIGIALLSIFLSACSSLLTSNDDVHYFYVVNPVGDVIKAKRPADTNLAVLDVKMPEWLDTQHIILRRGDNRIDYYAEARWATSASTMLTEIVSESLIANHVARNLVGMHAGMNADYLLVLEVTSFEAKYTSAEAPPTVEVAMHGKLLALPGEILHYQFTVKNSTKASSNNLSAIIRAFDSSTEACLTDVVERTAHGLAVK
jgi:ABC-type uncharacterized transport system auxiliary subunit